MMSRKFNEWLSKFKYSISGYNYYIDFEKVYRNVDSIKIELNILNSLIGSKNIENDFEELIDEVQSITTPPRDDFNEDLKDCFLRLSEIFIDLWD